MADDMDLPEGKACGDCVHCERCCKLFGHVPEDTRCDWSPSRYREAPTPATEDVLRERIEALGASLTAKESMLCNDQEVIERLESDLAEARQERNREADRRIEMNLDRAEMMLNLAEAQAALAALVAMCRKCYTDPDTGVEFRPYAVIKDWPNLTAQAEAHDAALLEQGRQAGLEEFAQHIERGAGELDARHDSIAQEAMLLAAQEARALSRPTAGTEEAGNG